ncbi:hypothetical protein VTJ04DRAFT_125 [Mycothermus thermophilus]|uniref:uncharacterized protein n=1 Tax=Humicola insolens TaxID=85995 RepID=UPI003742D182
MDVRRLVSAIAGQTNPRCGPNQPVSIPRKTTPPERDAIWASNKWMQRDRPDRDPRRGGLHCGPALAAAAGAWGRAEWAWHSEQ